MKWEMILKTNLTPHNNPVGVLNVTPRSSCRQTAVQGVAVQPHLHYAGVSMLKQMCLCTADCGWQHDHSRYMHAVDTGSSRPCSMFSSCGPAGWTGTIVPEGAWVGGTDDGTAEYLHLGICCPLPSTYHLPGLQRWQRSCHLVSVALCQPSRVTCVLELVHPPECSRAVCFVFSFTPEVHLWRWL